MRDMAIRKASAAVVAGLVVMAVAGLATLDTSDHAPAAVDGDLRGTASGLLGAIPAVAEGEAETPQALLGRALFWDERLSANGKVACAGCHGREDWGSDRQPKSTDARGRKTERQSQTVFNAMDSAGLRWLGDRASGEEQAVGSITGSMGFAKRGDIVPVLLRHGYEEPFRAAFPDQGDPVTPANYGVALQAYQATLRTPAAFDRWLAGDDAAMDGRQLRGLRRFFETGCAGCHNGPLLGAQTQERFGIAGNYWEHTGSAQIDSGLMVLTRQERDRFVFRVPGLRNVARTAPYFHDGSVAELRRAVRIMGRLQLDQELDDEAVDELVAFLEALTGEVPDHYAPPGEGPAELPRVAGRGGASGGAVDGSRPGSSGRGPGLVSILYEAGVDAVGRAAGLVLGRSDAATDEKTPARDRAVFR